MSPLGFDPKSLFSKASSNRRRAALGGRRSLALGFEALEPRQMLAADMAEIIGTVRLDVQGDGNAANDQLVAGANVTLYRDNGNGSFDPNDAAVGSPVNTDVLGQYRFSGLGVGKYFVKLTLPPALQSKPGDSLKEINILAADADGVIGQTIDGFTTVQKAEAAPPLPSSQPSTQIDPAVMGGERDLFVELTDGTDIFSSVALISGGGLLRLASDTTVTGNAKIVWDGQDGNAAGVNPTGLGGLDFTKFNGNTMTGILLAVGADHENCIIKLRVYTSAGRWSEFTATVPETQGGAATRQVTFNFDGAPTTSAGGGADFASVGAVELTFVGVSAVDGQVSLVGLIGLTTKVADFTAYNRLSLGNQVFNDADNDGQRDSGEQGIAGVDLNLYKDVDGNNQFTAGVDTFVSTTTTDASGNYQFTDLLPGAYIVQVDPVNFLTGQTLAGLASSKGAAADPDNNVDNDDNGTPLIGEGVVSQAIALTASNNTLDFGFFGFDLVLDKAVEQTSVSPLETVTYTVRIINDGPSTATGVQFVDNLPSGVTYKSLTVDKAGVNLVHNAGVITGSLGNMAAGDVIVVTIQVEVKATATGILRNEAEVSAPDEEYLLNNRDEVENPVTPKIDLAIDKSDSQDPVTPGGVFRYIITVTNNGPSNATGVVVTDDLPPQVSYQSDTRNGSLAGDKVTFNIGNMAAGTSLSFEITVKVDADFVGTLHNHVEVHGNETEITLTNNEDDEPTVVKADPASISGYVYSDKNNNGLYDSGEAPIGGVMMSLIGTDINGVAVNRNTTTGTNGAYEFDNLAPGTYAVRQVNQPLRFRDGIDTIGNTFNAQGDILSTPNGFPTPDTSADDGRDGEGLEGIQLSSGFAAVDYNFGELAVTSSKTDFLRPLFMQ